MYLLSDLKVNKKIIALFGEGLIGSSIIGALSRQFERETITFTYDYPEEHSTQLGEIIRRISLLSTDTQSDLYVIWSAGKVGFSATERDAESELAIYRIILDFACFCAELYPIKSCSFYCISSAGGLFEGQKLVTPLSKPNPRRPYGRLKMTEEDLLLCSPMRIRKKIYRLSTVYGPVKKGYRLGLISTLIYNGICHNVSHIVGNSASLRDYIWNGDIGRYIARDLEDDFRKHNDVIVHLASGKPSSIDEIKQIIEKILDKKIYIAFSYANENSSDITFSKMILPECWNPVDIKTAAQSIYNDWKKGGGIL